MKKNVFSYVGYAIKSRSAVFGVDNIAANRKSKVVLYDDDLSDNGKERLMKVIEKNKIRGFIADIEELYPDHNCKAIGITDINLASAIIKAMEDSDVND